MLFLEDLDIKRSTPINFIYNICIAARSKKAFGGIYSDRHSYNTIYNNRQHLGKQALRGKVYSPCR